jgi:RNA polymerase sigma-70 factor (ECF subfamily)
MSEREAIRASRAAIEASVRIESPRVIGALVRIVRDVALAEDLAQEALVAALETWPSTGIPDRPGAWLVTTAKRRAIDELRRRERLERAHDALSAALPQATSMDPSLEEPVADDVLRLVLVSCHPVLSPEARVALTLRLVAGLTTSEIARAYLVPEATIAQRIVRAKKTLSAARVPFEVPAGSELSERLGAVREVLYLVFNEGYAASRGERWTRPELCEEALRLARILGAHVPDDAETHGLLALLELQASRLRARHDARGRPVLLADQDRTRWDRLLVERGLRALERAEALARPSGPYTLQAGIAACHARAPSVEETDWSRIVALYDALVALTGSPIVELNRAVAVSRAEGPAAALVLLDTLTDEPALASYPYLPAARGEVLLALGRRAEAAAALDRAAALTENGTDREMLLARARAARDQSVS